MKLSSRIAAFAAMCALPAQAMAQSACLTRADAQTVMVAMLPSVVETLHTSCAPYLLPSAGLIARGPELAARYDMSAAGARGEAGRIAASIIENDADTEIFEYLSGDMVLDMFEAAVTSQFAGSLDASSCATANDFFGALEPLPADNLATLAVLLMEIGMRDDEPGEGPPLRLCETIDG